MLSMVAGDAVDDALLEKLRALTSEHSIARAILGLQVGYLLGRRFLLYFTLPNKRRAHLRALTSEHSTARAILGLQVDYLLSLLILYFTLPNKRRAHLRALTHSIAHAILGLQVRVLFY